MNSLVHGGTPDIKSNRMLELAPELESGANALTTIYSELIEESTTLEEVALILDVLADTNINIVGSRDYVYQSRAMAVIIRHSINTPDKVYPGFFTLLPRALGLRAKVIELFVA